MVTLLRKYFVWHFFDVSQEILKGWRNFLKFNLNYFSIPLLIRSFFSHWHKYKMSYGRGFDIGRYFEVFVFNSFSRCIGAILRFFLILIGLLFEILIIIFGLTVFLIWIFLPFFLVFGLLIGLILLI